MPCEQCPHCKQVKEDQRIVAQLLAEQAAAAATAAAAAVAAMQSPIRPIVSPEKKATQVEVQQLRDGQSSVAMQIINSRAEQKLHVVDGIAGSGKTYFLYQLGALMKNLNLVVSHISASEFGTPNNKSIRSLLNNRDYSDESDLNMVDVILIDNAQRIPIEQLTELSNKLQRARRNPELFGGVTVVLAVDFAMPLPYCKEGWYLKEKKSPKTFLSDKQFKQHRLETPENPSDHWIEEIRTSPTAVISDRHLVKTMDSLIEFVYGKLHRKEPYKTGILLAPRKMFADELNREVMKKLAGKPKVFEAVFNGNIIRSDLDLHTIELKKKTIVVLDQPCLHLPVGTRLMVTDWDKHFLLCEVLDGPRQGEKVEIPRVERNLAATAHESQQHVLQFPISVNFAATIHSAQRRFDKVGLYKLEESFEHGMVYCALSRTDSMFRVKVLTENPVIQTNYNARFMNF